PILFRVVLAVLAFFGGIGLVLYLTAWLLLPAEGDTASPLEALFGRGQSGTSSLVTVVLGIGAVVALAVVFNSGLSTAVLLGTVVVGVVLLMRRTVPPGPVGWGPPPPGLPGTGAPFQPAPGAPTPSTWAAATAGATPPGAVPQVPAGAPARQDPTAPPPEGFSAPYAPYRAPFSPHGPYGSQQPPGPPRSAPSPRPPKERSILGRLTFSLVFLALGVLAIVDVSGAEVPFTAYPALALTVVAVGMLVGAWYGRARWLIPLGIVSVLALAIGAGADRVSRYDYDRTVTFAPASVAELRSPYRLPAGHLVLDLRQVDFSAHDVDVDIAVDIGTGEVDVLLPPAVDVEVASSVGFGDIQVLGHQDHGGGLDLVRTDLGSDGQGGGKLRLDIELGFGDLEVTR
ncbi:MAG TPA: LiaF domain-containing protein, partial [Cryptosporangiaceae bacterium]|nr:LiaF domain-containing protein [Cryptosporangiaceae bacterium]